MEAATVDAPVDANLWVSLAEAGRRQNPPVSREAVRKRVERLTADGRLTTRPGPRGSVLVNIAAYLRAVREETDPAQALRNRAPLLAEEPEDEASTDGGEAPASGGGYHDARARREAINAESARLDLEERLGALVMREDVERRIAQMLRIARDRLQGLPAALAEKLAAQPDARSIRAVLQTEIRRALEALASEFDAFADDEDEGGEGEGPDIAGGDDD